MVKKYTKILGYILTTISFLFLALLLVDNINKLSLDIFNIESIYIFIIGILIVVVGHIILAYCWFLLLKDKNAEFTLKHALIIVGLSQIAKYIPGNLAHLIGRLYLAKQWFTTKIILSSLIIESLSLIAVAFALTCLWQKSYKYIEQYYLALPFIQIILLTITSIFIIGLYFFRDKIHFKEIRIVPMISVCYLLSFLFYGLFIYLLFSLVFHVNNISFMQCTFGFAFAFLAGYVLPGAPGGLGVREAIFVLLFSSFVFDQSIPLQIIIITRVITILGDCAVFVIANRYKTQVLNIKET